MRIDLAEWVVDDPSYRGAYLMELDDAERFANHILRRVKRQRLRDEAKAKKNQKSESEP